MAKPDTVYSMFGIKSPQQVAQEQMEASQKFLQSQTDPYSKLGSALGLSLGRLFGGVSPEMQRSRQFAELMRQAKGDIAAQRAERAKTAEAQIADRLGGIEGAILSEETGRGNLPLVQAAKPTREEAMKQSFEAKASEMELLANRLEKIPGFEAQAEAARDAARESRLKIFALDEQLASTAAKQQQIAASKQSVAASKQSVAASRADQDRAAKEALFKQWTQQNTKDKQASLKTLVKSPDQLKALGISDDLVTQITSSENPAAWYSYIEEKMKANATATTKDAPTSLQEAESFYKLTEQIIALEKEAGGKRTPESRRLRLRALSVGRAAGITDVAVYERMVKDSTEKAQAASVQSAETARTIAWMEQNKSEMLSGLSESTRALFADLFGSQSPRDLINKKYTEIFTKEVINNLPPGVASDRDVALVLEGVIPANASPDIMIRYMKGLQTLAQARQAYHSEFLSYMEDITKGQDAAGFDMYYREKQRVNKVKQLVDYGISADRAEEIVDSGDLEFSRRVRKEEDRRNPPQPSAGPTIDALRAELDAMKGETTSQVTEQPMP